MQKHRRALPLLAAFFVLLTMTITAPQAAAAGWPAPLGDTDNNVVFTQANGRVTVAGCGDGTYEQRTFGGLVDQVAALRQASAKNTTLVATGLTWRPMGPSTP